jgi:hypothetical protein
MNKIRKQKKQKRRFTHCRLFRQRQWRWRSPVICCLNRIRIVFPPPSLAPVRAQFLFPTLNLILVIAIAIVIEIGIKGNRFSCSLFVESLNR